MSIQKLKNRVKSLETELFGQGGPRIPEDERVLVINSSSGSLEAKRVQKEFESMKDNLREKYGDFDDSEVQCVHIIGHFNPEDMKTNETS